MNKAQLNLFSLLRSSFNVTGDIHFLAIAEKEIPVLEKEQPVHQIRVALTFQEGDTVNPYYDGTDLFVTIEEDNIQFALERDWADGPPAIEGSPIERNKLKYVTYRCGNRDQCKACKNPELRREYIESYVIDELQKKIFNDESIPMLAKQLTEFQAKKDESYQSEAVMRKS